MPITAHVSYQLEEHGHNNKEIALIDMSLTLVALDDILLSMEETQDSLLYSLSSGLKGNAESVKGRRYLAHMKSAGTFDDAALQAALAAELGKDVDYVRYVESLRRKAIMTALRAGKRVYVGGVALQPAVRGPFETIDGEFDSKRNKIVVAGFAYGDLQSCLQDCVPQNVVKGGRPTSRGADLRRG